MGRKTASDRKTVKRGWGERSESWVCVCCSLHHTREGAFLEGESREAGRSLSNCSSTIPEDLLCAMPGAQS